MGKERENPPEVVQKGHGHKKGVRYVGVSMYAAVRVTVWKYPFPGSHSHCAHSLLHARDRSASSEGVSVRSRANSRSRSAKNNAMSWRGTTTSAPIAAKSAPDLGAPAAVAAAETRNSTKRSAAADVDVVDDDYVGCAGAAHVVSQ